MRTGSTYFGRCTCAIRLSCGEWSFVPVQKGHTLYTHCPHSSNEKNVKLAVWRRRIQEKKINNTHVKFLLYLYLSLSLPIDTHAVSI